MDLETRHIASVVCRKGGPIYVDGSTIVSIMDDGDGEFVKVAQEDGGISVNVEEWPAIRAAIDAMIQACRSK